ncbi:site-specific integrase [bacterium]|nr:site-specific integrase [bacterium]
MKRIKTNYPGVYYRLVERTGGSGKEKVFYIRFKQKSIVVEEKVGRQFVDDMTAAKAARLRGERIEGKRLSRKETEAVKRAEKEAEKARPTISRLWEAYKAGKPESKSLRSDELMFLKHIAPMLGEKTPEELVPLDLDRLRIKLQKNYSNQTIAYILKLVKRLVNFGHRKQLCGPLSIEVEIPKVNNIKTEDLTPEQLKKLVELLDSDKNVTVARLMKIALFTGMRRGELFRLKWGDVNFQRDNITLHDPKGGQDQTIPLNSAARELLELHKTGRGESEYVFPGRGGNMRVDIKKEANRIKKAAGLPDSFRALHGLRHVYASMMASSGKVDMYTLQKLLTHKSPQMTQRYAHLRDEALRNAANLAGELVEQAVKSLDKKHAEKKGA